MNTNDWYTREKLARIKQDEILRDAQNAHLFPANFKSALANHKPLVAVGVLVGVIILIALMGVGV